MKLRRALAMASLTVTLLAIAATSVRAQERVDLLLDWTWWPPQIPYIVAVEKGFYRDAGLNVRLQQGQGSGTTAQLVAQGTYEIGNVDLTVAALAISKGAKMRAVANTVATSAQGLIFKKDSGIKEVKDIVGRRIGSSPGDSSTQLFPAFLEYNQIDPKQVPLVSMPGEAKLPGLLNGTVDVIAGDGNYYIALAAAKGFELEEFRFADHGASMIGYGLVANESMIQNRPDVIRKFVEATGKGFEFARQNVDEAVTIYDRVAHLNQDPKLVRQILVGFLKLTEADEVKGKPFGWNSPKLWTSTLDILVKYGGLERALPLESYYTNEFVE